MKVATIERYEEVLVRLYQDVDFRYTDLQDDRLFHGIKSLPVKFLDEVAFNNGFNFCSWTGNYNPEDKSVDVKFRKYLYV